MRKFLIVAIAAMLALSLASYCYAGSADARTANYGQGIMGVQGIGDLSSGNTVEVTSTGSAHVTNRATAIGVANFADTLIYTGACYVQSIHIAGAAAGDYAMVYDALTATGTPKFDPRIAVNTSSLSYDTKGAPFATGIYVDVSGAAVFVSVVYDY